MKVGWNDLVQQENIAILPVGLDPFPVDTDHYVVYTGSSQDAEIQIFDLPDFTGTWSREMLESHWHGVALLISVEPLSIEHIRSGSKTWLPLVMFLIVLTAAFLVISNIMRLRSQ